MDIVKLLKTKSHHIANKLEEARRTNNMDLVMFYTLLINKGSEMTRAIYMASDFTEMTKSDYVDIILECFPNIKREDVDLKRSQLMKNVIDFKEAEFLNQMNLGNNESEELPY